MQKLTQKNLNELKLSVLLSTLVFCVVISIDILLLIYLINTVDALRVVIYCSGIGITIGYLAFKIFKIDVFEGNGTSIYSNKKILKYIFLCFSLSIFITIVFHYFIYLKYHMMPSKGLVIDIALITMAINSSFLGGFLLNMILLLIKLNSDKNDNNK
ncbi:hypothetical protein [Methanotorris formicicus]|uniref:Uncharacterized protein n=1 Tax=Methanotorris formicicus Mc-S-70 TaxID=647171 RepID=H1KYF6_9EURY|nr:hypothetical protein [Methanotorris formicicus]EHP87240.1 hypothetical protein MetfoDRAFT_0829 [Methanotorris formicicus Mc-S-70]